MASSIEIANRALTLLGDSRITSFDDQTKGALAVKTQYDMTRKSELRASRWGFAMKRAAIPALASVPAFGFGVQCQLPADLLRLDFVGDFFVGASLAYARVASEGYFAVEGRLLLTNISAPVRIRYIWDIVDATQFDPLFVDALAHRLAMDVGETLTASQTKKADVAKGYSGVIDRAVRINAIERPPEPLPDDTWMLSRL